MNRYLIYIASFLLMANLFASCDEVEEVGLYDHWRPRNEAFIDSIHALVGDHLVPLIADETIGGKKVDDIEANVLFALETTASTNEAKQYVYCKKIVSSQQGARPLHTDKVSAFYYGTNILGERFDGNFTGYSATDTQVLDKDGKKPTEFDSPTDFAVSGVIPGWTTALQYMHPGERWMLYIPYQSAYGESDYNGILGYSALTFDLVLEEVVK